MMPLLPRVTVAIPTRNRSAFLRETLQSVLDQTLSELEVFVADNASTDDTAEVVSSFDDPRVFHVPTARNIGIHANTARCLAFGTAPYLTILHDDDLMLSGHLQRKVALLEERPDAGVVYSNYRVIGPQGQFLRESVVWPEAPAPFETGAEYIYRSMAVGSRTHLSATLIRRSLIGDETIEEGDGAYFDLGFWLRLARRANFAYIDDSLVAVRLHPRSVSAGRGLYSGTNDSYDTETIEQFHDAYRAKERFIRSLPAESRRELHAVARGCLERELLGMIRRRSRRELRAGEAIRLLTRAVRLFPPILASRQAVDLLVTALFGPGARRHLRSIRRAAAGRRRAGNTASK
jgi:glycosyltransferase involved in cell wall biosynthesis